MAFSTTTNKALYSGNGVTTAFAAPFLFYSNSHIDVQLIDKTTGVGVTQVLTTNYTVTGAGVPTGGTVTMLVAPPSTHNLLVRRIVPQTQGVDLKEGDKLPPETLEQSFDTLTMMVQQLAEVDSRCVKLPVGTSLANIEIPDINLTVNRGKVFQVNATGTGFDVITVSTSAVSSPLTTKGDIAVHNGTLVARQGVGTDGTILEADSTQATGVKWGSAPIKQSVVTAKGDILVATASGVIVRKAVGSNGQTLRTDASQTDNLAYGAPGGYRNGLILSNNAVDAVNDIDIATGEASSDDSSWANRLVMNAGAMTKQLDAVWAAGSAAGGRISTEALADGTWYVYLFRRSTGADDYCFSQSLTPTLPDSGTKKRYIGSILREAGVIVPFTQTGKRFIRTTSIADVAASNPGTAAVSRTLSVPTGRVYGAILTIGIANNDASICYCRFTDLATVDASPASTNSDLDACAAAAGRSSESYGQMIVNTNTARQIRTRVSYSSVNVSVLIRTHGWEDQNLDS